jgi:anti-sigma B factor antagonist
MSSNPPPPAPGSNPAPNPGPRPLPGASGPGHPPRTPGKFVPGSKAAPKLSVIVGPENIAIVTLLESRILDETNINELGRQLMELVTKRYMIKMIIDLANVQYLSSAVLRQFIALYKAIKEEKGDLKLCRVAPQVREVFKITQLDKMIEICEDLDTATNSFKQRKGGWGFLTR